VAVNKCNISSYIIDEINNLIWGYKCVDNTNAILENYIQYIGCADANLVTCFPDNCNNPTINFTCTLSIANGIIAIVDQDTNTVQFTLNAANITNGLAPYQYTWTYNPNDLTPIGPINGSVVSFSAKEGKLISDLVTAVMIEVVDANNCTATKTCYLVTGQVQCATNYNPCYTASALKVINSVVVAVPPSGLIVRHV
jgi:hypothetical protein